MFSVTDIKKNRILLLLIVSITSVIHPMIMRIDDFPFIYLQCGIRYPHKIYIFRLTLKNFFSIA